MADKEQDKRKINYRGLILEAIKLIASEREIPRGTEKDLVQDFLGFHRVGNYEDRIPATRECKIVLEHVFKYGRADIVMYHSDGSASVIEAKDGTKGYSHVVSGIGQATLYAVQLANTKGAVTLVRRCLMWSSTGNTFLDGLIEEVCEQAGVIPLPMPSLSSTMFSRACVEELISKQGSIYCVCKKTH